MSARRPHGRHYSHWRRVLRQCDVIRHVIEPRAVVGDATHPNGDRQRPSASRNAAVRRQHGERVRINLQQQCYKRNTIDLRLRAAQYTNISFRYKDQRSRSILLNSQINIIACIIASESILLCIFILVCSYFDFLLLMVFIYPTALWLQFSINELL